MTEDTPDLITMNEAARILGCSYSNVRRLVKRGKIPVDSVFLPPGARTDWKLVKRADVVAYKEQAGKWKAKLEEES